MKLEMELLFTKSKLLTSKKVSVFKNVGLLLFLLAIPAIKCCSVEAMRPDEVPLSILNSD